MSTKPKAATSFLCWREAKLGDVLPLRYGKARSSQFGYPRPGTATFGSNGVFGTFERALTTRATLIVGRKGAAGAVHYSPDPCWPIDTAFYTEGNDRTFLPFFRYLLESLRLVALDRSTAIPSLSRDDYGAGIVRYPESTDDQRQIVAEIEKQFTRLEAGVAALTRAQANLTRYRAAVLKAAFDGHLVAVDPKGVGPERWKQVRVGEALNLINGRAFKPTEWSKTGAPIVRIQNLNNPDAPFNYYDGDLPEKFLLSNGDLLFAWSGTPGTSFGAHIWRGGKAWLNQHIFKVHFDDAQFDKRFLQLAINQNLAEYIRAAHGGAGLAHITKGKFEVSQLICPPLAEQKRIVAEVERRLSVVEELEAMVFANLHRAARLRQSILQQAFSGSLTHTTMK